MTLITVGTLLEDVVRSDGLTMKQGERYGLADDVWQQGSYVVGATGSGKTTWAASYLGACSRLHPKRAMLVLDPKGDLVEAVVARLDGERMQDVLLLDPWDSAWSFGINLLECADPADPALQTETVSAVMHVFNRLWDVSRRTPELANVLRNACYVLLANGLTLAELPALLYQDHYRQRLLAAETINLMVRSFWETEFAQWAKRTQDDRTSSTLNKVREFLSNPMVYPIIGQASTINFARMRSEGRIILCPFKQRMGTDVISLLGTTILSKFIQQAVYGVSHPGSLPVVDVCLDEFTLFQTPDLPELWFRGRSYGVCTMACHQTRSQLSEEEKGATLNAGVKVIFNVTGMDAEDLAKDLAVLPQPASRKLVQRPYNYLAQHGHANVNVADAFEKLREILNRWHHRVAGLAGDLFTGGTRTRLEARFEYITDEANRYLLGRMSAPHLPPVVFSHPLVFIREKITWLWEDEAKHYRFVEVAYPRGGTTPDGRPDHTLWPQEKEEVASEVEFHLTKLGDLLAQPENRLEVIDELAQRRFDQSLADARLTMAEQLANLPNYQYIVKARLGTSIVQRRLASLAPVARSPHLDGWLAFLRQAAQQEVCHHRQAIEAAIQERLQLPPSPVEPDQRRSRKASRPESSEVSIEEPARSQGAKRLVPIAEADESIN